MQVLTVGAGAVGAYLAGSLAQAGHEVRLFLRPAAAARIREHGLELRLSETERQNIALEVVGSAEEAFQSGPYDFVILAVKAYQVQAALSPFGPYKKQLPPVLCLQNGIGSEDQAAELIGASRVIPASLTTAVARLPAGHVVLERKRGLAVGDTHPTAAALVKALDEAGLNARLYSDAAAMKWSKLLTNLLANASSAILDMTPDEIFANPDTFVLEIRQLREALAVIAALNLQVVNLPGTPVRALAWAAQRLPAWASRPLLRRAVGRGRGGKMPSFHIDLHAGRRQSEVQYLNGAVSAFGGKLGIPTPVNTVFTETLLGLITGEEPPSNFAGNPKQLLGRLGVSL